MLFKTGRLVRLFFFFSCTGPALLLYAGPMLSCPPGFCTGKALLSTAVPDPASGRGFRPSYFLFGLHMAPNQIRKMPASSRSSTKIHSTVRSEKSGRAMQYIPSDTMAIATHSHHTG